MLGTVTAMRRSAAALAPLLLCYALAAAVPRPGIVLRHLAWRLPGVGGLVDVQSVLLAVVLFCGGMSVRPTALRSVLRRPIPLVAAVAANTVLPFVLVPLVALALSGWPERAEAEGLSVGLLLMLAMPVAAGAVPWGQRAGADAPLLVGTVLGSTLLSPLTVPVCLLVTGVMVGPGGVGVLDDTATLHRLAATGAGGFAVFAVVLPCVCGLAVRSLTERLRWEGAAPAASRLNMGLALVLSYTNACGGFAQMRRNPDPGLLLVEVPLVAAVCGVSFLFGAVGARLTGAGGQGCTTMALAAGMSNSSAAAVLAGSWFPALPGVLLPILCYSLLQKTGAGVVAARAARHGSPAQAAVQTPA